MQGKVNSQYDKKLLDIPFLMIKLGCNEVWNSDSGYVSRYISSYRITKRLWV